MSDAEFSHFIEAQRQVIDRVERELLAGRKQSHWMWFIFPQLDGLGHSPMSTLFGIRDLAAARRYLEHPLLGGRLRRHVQLVLAHSDQKIGDILGPPDDMKFRSSLTLFRLAASGQDAEILFESALDAFYSGLVDDRTLALLGQG